MNEHVPDVYVTEIYCWNSDCNVRESRVSTKDLGDNPEPQRWRCPGCGKPCNVHWRRTLREQARYELRDSILRVNGALYERENPECPMLPISVLMLTELPASWRCAERKS